jgi:hypothetical protein
MMMQEKVPGMAVSGLGAMRKIHLDDSQHVSWKPTWKMQRMGYIVESVETHHTCPSCHIYCTFGSSSSSNRMMVPDTI